MTVAAILHEQKIPAATALVVVPGSKQTLENILRDGGLGDVVSAGARLDETACGFCIGAAQAPATGSVSVRTSNRNFAGRSGTKNDQVYLVSPETAAATALRGELTDPRSLGRMPQIKMPERLIIDDSMIVAPPPEGTPVEIVRGPNIGEPPFSTALDDELAGQAALKVGDKITTDHIMPAGSLLRLRSNIPEYSKHVFTNVDAEFAGRAAGLRDAGRAAFVVAGQSYGQGSSREHAAICPRYLGVQAIICKSLERIHGANLVNFGILPLVFCNVEDYDWVEQGDELRMVGLKSAVASAEELTVENVSKGRSFKVRLDQTARSRGILLAGGLLNMSR